MAEEKATLEERLAAAAASVEARAEVARASAARSLLTKDERKLLGARKAIADAQLAAERQAEAAAAAAEKAKLRADEALKLAAVGKELEAKCS